MVDKEKAGMRQLLDKLSSEELLALVKTTTSDLISPGTREECIDVIIRFSDGPSLLSRKIIKKEILASYLNDHRKEFKLSITKPNLCSEVLKLWSCPLSDGIFPKNQESDEHVASASMAAAQDESFGIEFSKWFYNRWNSGGLSRVDFWIDCSLRIELCSNEEFSKLHEVVSDGIQCFETLKEVIRKEQLTFCPNYDQGIKENITIYGPVQVTVCGTVHGSGAPKGVFEQMFGLIRDPSSDNNYKIKFTILKCKATSVQSLPAPTQAALEYSTLNQNLQIQSAYSWKN